MVYHIYAMFVEGSYLVATSTDADHGMDLAHRVCSDMGQPPMALAALTPDATINGALFDLDALKKRK